MASFKLQIK